MLYLLLLCYCCAAIAIVVTRIALDMETAALGALECITPLPLKSSMHTRRKNNCISGIPRHRIKENQRESRMIY